MRTPGSGRKARVINVDWHSEDADILKVMEDYPSNKYSKPERLNCVYQYIMSGNLSEVGRRLEIPKKQLETWKKQPWWDLAKNKCLEEHRDFLDTTFSDCIKEAIKEIKDRIVNGDEVLSVRTGEIHRKKMSGKDLAVTSSILFDKRQLLRNQPTSIGTKNAADLKALAENFDKMADRPAEKPSDIDAGLAEGQGSSLPN